MTYSFNLIDKNWIPCITPDGQTRELSLRETFKLANKLSGIAGDSPLETAAIYRLLLAVLHSALRGPENTAAWNDLWQAGTWDTPWLNTYLDKWQFRFDLFDKQCPFYQARDERVKPKSIISLAMDMTSGNNATLFDHHTEEIRTDLTPEKAGRVLIVAQSFGLAGLSGLDQKFTDAPWGRGIVFLVEGDTLFETLALNLIRYGGDYPRDVPTIGVDCPAWEADDPYKPRKIPNGYLDYLTWQNRRILLLPEGDYIEPHVSQCTIAPGLRMDASLLDPFKNYRQDKKSGYKPTRFSEKRVLWRDSSALFNVKAHPGKHPPSNFAWVAKLVDNKPPIIGVRRTLRLKALGMANNKAKVDFFREEHMPLPLVYLESAQSEALIGGLTYALELTESTYSKLRTAIFILAKFILFPNADHKGGLQPDTKDINNMRDYFGFERYYWGALEIPFLRLLEGLPNEPQAAMSEWKSILKDTAWQTLEKATDQVGITTHALKAAVRARGSLGYGLKE